MADEDPSCESEAPRRSTRRTVRNRYRVPNPEHYVGYVADEETPEMIMKKFEQLERVMETTEEPAATSSQSQPMTQTVESGNAAEGEAFMLTANQLKTLCEATGASEVREAFRSDAEFLEGSEISNPADSDEEFELSKEEIFWEESEASLEKRPKSKRPKTKNQFMLPSQTAGGGPQRIHVAKKQSNGLIQLRVPPPPIPPSWGRAIQPLGTPITASSTPTAPEPVASSPGRVIYVSDVVSADWRTWGESFMGVMVLPLWRSLRQFEALALPDLCPEGFLFLWIPKRFLQAVWQIVKAWAYSYVENLTWVQLQPNNKPSALEEPSSLLPRAHSTLYIFRRSGRGRDIEIRHQRSSDVVFDVARPSLSYVPHEVYSAVETMLPGATGKLLELWSTTEAQRLGWVQICEGTPNQ